MLAVVVLQTKPARVQVIVPEKCIYGLDEVQAQLKTWGVNSQHQHVIFWKRDFLDETIPPNITEQPDFSLTIRDDFPLPTNINAACYYGRVKRFFCKYSMKFDLTAYVDITTSLKMALIPSFFCS